MKLAVWSPLPPSPVGHRGLRGGAAARASRAPSSSSSRIRRVDRGSGAREPRRGGRPDLDLYHLGNSPAHAFVYRAALRRPGRGRPPRLEPAPPRAARDGGARRRRRLPARDAARPRRGGHVRGPPGGARAGRRPAARALPAERPRPRGQPGRRGASPRDVARARRAAAARAAACSTCRTTSSLPLDPLPSRAEARARAGPAARTRSSSPRPAWPPRPSASTSRVARWRAAARRAIPRCGSWWRATCDPRLPLDDWARAAGLGDALRRHRAAGPAPTSCATSCAADVVLALRFPSHGEMSGALVRALGVGRPVLVTAGTPAAEEFPEGVVVPVDPGPARGGRAGGAARPPARARRTCASAIGALAARARPRAPRPRADRGARWPGFLRRWPRGKDDARWPRWRAERARGGRPPRLLHGGGALGRARPRPGRRPRSASRPLLASLLAERAVSAPLLSVVIPAYNEAARLPPTLARDRARILAARARLRDPGGGRRLAATTPRSGRAARGGDRAAQRRATAARATPCGAGMLPARGRAPADDRRRPLDAHRGAAAPAGRSWTRATTW